MARRTPSQVLQSDAVRALARYRRLRLIPLLILLALAASSWYSYSNAPADPRAADGEEVAVHEIVDGDTIRVRMPGGKLEKVRLKAIDAPELAHDGKPDDHYAIEAKRYLHARIDARFVTLQFEGTEKRDRFGRLLAFVYASDDECINATLVRDGFAYVDRRFDSYMTPELGRLEGEARKKQRGLWQAVTEAQMPEWRQRWLERRRGDRAP